VDHLNLFHGTLPDKIEFLTIARNTIQKAVSDLSNKIVNLQYGVKECMPELKWGHMLAEAD